MKGQKALWLTGGLIAVLATYTLAGFLLAPGLLERRLSAALATHTGLDVAIGHVRVNPFLLRADFDDLVIGAPGTAPAVTVTNVVAWGRIDDAFRRGLQIDALTLTSPHLTQDATTGLWRYLAGLHQTGDAFLIRQIDVVAGEVYLPGKVAQGVRATIDHLSITELGNDRQSEFRLGSIIAGTGTLSASGSLAFNPTRVDSSLNMTGIELGAFGALRLPDTQLHLSSAALGGRTHLVIERDRVALDGELSLERLALIAPDVDKPVFEAHSISGAAVSVEFSPLTITAQRLRVTAPRLHLMRDFEGAFAGGEWLVVLARGPQRFFPAAGSIEWSDGQVDLRDFAISPPVRTVASGIEGSIAEEHDAVSLELAGRLADGDVQVGARWHPMASPATDEWHLDAVGVKAEGLSRYLAELTGHTVRTGEFDLMIDARASQTDYHISNTLQLAKIEIVEPDAPEAVGSWPLSLAIALLEDADGIVRTSVSLPVLALADGTTIAAQIRDAFAQHVAAIANQPFDVLSQIAGVPESGLGEVAFDAGSAAPSDAARERLVHLAAVMQQRPGIGIEVTGCYDPNADRDALARTQMRLHIALATSAGAPDRAARGPLEFADPRVVSVLEEFAGKRLPGEQVAALRETFGGTGQNFYAALFDALVANEPVSDRALKNIARFRAQSVVSELAAAGVAAQRLLVARSVEEREAQNGALVVPLRVVKTER